jgi:hypothetical protein
MDGMPASCSPRLAPRMRLTPTMALLARSGDLLYTSDPGDLRKLCEAAGIKAVVIGC